MRSRLVLILLAALILWGIIIRLAYVHRTIVIVDEFEHLHGAYLVSHGETPYKDFFEHHSPLFYYLAAPLIPAEPSFATIIHARYLALAMHALAIGLAALWMGTVFGRTEALVATALLVGNFFLFARGTLGYLDTHALPFVLLGAWALAVCRGRPARAALCGASLGIACMITQKAGAAILAPVAFFLLRAPHELLRRSERGLWFRDALAFAAGGVGAVAALLVPLGLEGVRGFVRDAILLNVGWKAHRFPLRELSVLGVAEGPLYLTAVLGALLQGRDLIRRRLAVGPQDVPALFLAALAAGIFLLPVIWEEYFILVVPFATVNAALMLTGWWRRHLADGRPFATVLGRLGAGTMVVGVLVALMVADFTGRRLVGEDRLSAVAVGATLVLWGALGGAILAARSRRASIEPVLWVALFLSFPLIQQADWISHNSNDSQRARLAYVMQHTRPDDRVFDGYSGFGVFRPHAFRYWFLHEELLPMLSDEDRGPNLLRALAEQQPAIAIVDDYIRTLPQAVLDHLATHYEDTPYPDIKRRRNGVAAN